MFVIDILDVCGGVICGLGHYVMHFCTKPVGSCHTKGHQAKKVLLKNLSLYINHTRVGQAHLKPSLPKSFLSAELEVEDLMIKAKPFVEWSAYFEGLKAKKESEDASGTCSVGSSESWEKIKMPSIEAYSKAHHTLKTPKHLWMGGLQAVDMETIPMARARFDHFTTMESITTVE